MAITTRQSGLTMIEILVALLVLAIGLLGVAGMQTVSMQQTQGADQRSTAVLHVQTMADEIRTNKGLPSASDETAWENAVKEDLGDDATADIEVVTAGQTVRVEVTWNVRESVWDGGEEGSANPDDNPMYENSFSLLVRYAQ